MVQPPPLFLPRDAGQDERRGLEPFDCAQGKLRAAVERLELFERLSFYGAPMILRKSWIYVCRLAPSFGPTIKSGFT